MIYADQDEQRGCIKIISRTALSFLPVLISEMICGCLSLLLGLWTIYVTCHIDDHHNNLRYDDDEINKITPTTTTIPVTKYPYYQTNQTIQNLVPDMKVNDDQTNTLIDNHTLSRHSYPSIPFNKTNKSLYSNSMNT